MNWWQCHIGKLAWLLAIGLSSCSVPQRYELATIPGFASSHCASLQADGYVSTFPTAEPRRISIYPSGETPPDFIKGKRDRLTQGTQFHIDLVETWWDFENGHRLTIRGTLPIDNREQQFIFERFFTTEPDAKLFVQRAFTPCQ